MKSINDKLLINSNCVTEDFFKKVIKLDTHETLRNIVIISTDITNSSFNIICDIQEY
jgi:hypothetical protein